MSSTSQYGLIGKSLKHSFSKSYFENKFLELGLTACSYSLFELKSPDEFKPLLRSHPDLDGLNVTIPYKEQIIAFLDNLDPEAREIGAVNCITVRNGITKGYNTDAYGFSQSIKPFLDNNHERALILGTGGASRAVAHVLKKIGLEICFVTSRPDKKSKDVILYEELNALRMQAFKLVVNTTPLGMFPDTDFCPALPYEYFGPSHLAYDLIYNPRETLFLKKAKQYGALTMNGESMLRLQAEKSWEIWNRDA